MPMSNKDTSKKLHPKVAEARREMESGKLNRREFVRFAALLGVGAGSAYAMAGLPNPAVAQDAANLPFPPMTRTRSRAES